MVSRMVDAFKKGIEEDKDTSKESEERGRETITMNPRRRDILEYLCKYPCTRLSRIAKDLELSIAATKWHLERLTEKDFIVKEVVYGDPIFYPMKMIDENEVQIFATINHERATPILRKILSHSGISQKDLCNEVQLNQRTVVRHASELEHVGLIESIQDGKFKRYYPTALINTLREDYRRRAGKFRKHLLGKLKKDGVNPKVMRYTDNTLHVKITTGENKTILELNTQPFAGILEPYKGL